MKRLAICFVPLLIVALVFPARPALAQTATPIATPDGSGCFSLAWDFEASLGIWDADAGEVEPAINAPGYTGSYAAWFYYGATTTRVINATKEELATYFGTDVIDATDFTVSGYGRASDINGASSYLRINYTDASYSEYLLSGLTGTWSLISQAGSAGKYVESVRISITRNTTSSNAAIDDLSIDYCQPATPTPTPTETATATATMTPSTTPTAGPTPTPSPGCNSNSWDFEGGSIGEWATTTGSVDMAVRAPGYGSALAMYAEDASGSWYEQAIVGALDLPWLGYDVGELATWTGVYSTTNVLGGYVSLQYTDGYSQTTYLPATSSWTGFYFQSDGREIERFFVVVNGNAGTSAAFDNMVIEFCPPPTATPTIVPTASVTPWPTLYATPTPLPTFTPVPTWLPNLSDDPFDIIPPLPEPISITEEITYTLAITQFWNLDNLALIISTARTMPIILNRNHMLDVLLVIALITLVIFVFSKISFSRGTDL